MEDEFIKRKIMKINDDLPTDLSVAQRLEEISRRFRLTKKDARVLYKP